jgi:hypothetical protein
MGLDDAFAIMFGLDGNGLVTPLTPAFFALMIPLVFVQGKSLETLLRLNRKALGQGAGALLCRGLRPLHGPGVSRSARCPDAGPRARRLRQ